MRLLLLAMLLGSLSAVAQDSLAVRQSAEPQLTPATDTAAAIHRLFVAERHAHSFMLVTSIGIGTGALLAAHNTYRLDVALFPSLVGVLSIPVSLGVALGFDTYSPRRERLAIEALKTHRLSKKVKRELRPYDF